MLQQLVSDWSRHRSTHPLDRYGGPRECPLMTVLPVGRDKVLRTLQYFSRFYAWYLYRTNNPPAAIAPFNAVKTQFGLTRKIMRVGKFVEHFRAASELYDALAKIRANGGDQVLQYLQILRQLGYGFYLTCDMLTVLDAAGIKKSTSAKKLQQQAYKAWFVGLLASAIAGFYSNYQLMQKAKTINEKDGEGKVEAKKIERYGTRNRSRDVSAWANISADNEPSQIFNSFLICVI
jgi:peroxin-11B